MQGLRRSEVVTQRCFGMLSITLHESPQAVQLQNQAIQLPSFCCGTEFFDEVAIMKSLKRSPAIRKKSLNALKTEKAGEKLKIIIHHKIISGRIV